VTRGASSLQKTGYSYPYGGVANPAVSAGKNALYAKTESHLIIFLFLVLLTWVVPGKIQEGCKTVVC